MKKLFIITMLTLVLMSWSISTSYGLKNVNIQQNNWITATAVSASGTDRISVEYQLDMYGNISCCNFGVYYNGGWIMAPGGFDNSSSMYYVFWNDTRYYFYK